LPLVGIASHRAPRRRRCRPRRHRPCAPSPTLLLPPAALLALGPSPLCVATPHVGAAVGCPSLSWWAPYPTPCPSPLHVAGAVGGPTRTRPVPPPCRRPCSLAPSLVARRSRRGPPIVRPAPPRYTLLGLSAAPPALVPSPLLVAAPALWRRRWLPVALVVGPAAHALAPPCRTLLWPAAASPALVAFPLPVAAPALWRRQRPCASSLRPPSPFPSHLFGATAWVGAALVGAFSSVRPPLRLPVRLPVSLRRREDGVVRRARLCPGRV